MNKRVAVVRVTFWNRYLEKIWSENFNNQTDYFTRECLQITSSRASMCVCGSRMMIRTREHLQNCTKL